MPMCMLALEPFELKTLGVRRKPSRVRGTEMKNHNIASIWELAHVNKPAMPATRKPSRKADDGLDLEWLMRYVCSTGYALVLRDEK